MRSYRFSNLGLFAMLTLAIVACSSLNQTTQHIDNLRKKRQLSKYDPSSTTPLQAAVASYMCSPLTEEKNLCSINIKKLSYDHSLIIDPLDHTSFLYPDEQGTITLKKNQVVFLSCPGSNNALKNVPGSRAFSNFTCVCGTIFDAYGTIYDFDSLSCKFPPEHEIVDKGFYGRENEYRRFEVGFFADREKRFLKVVDVHYDRSTATTVYVKSKIPRVIAGRQRLAKLHRYDQTHCCERQQNRLDMDAIYSTKSQDRSFAAQLYCHDSEFRTRCSYLSESSAVIFNKCQLSPKSSFVYTSAGSATFVYLNTGPQWRPINDGNWARIEEHVIEMAKGLHKDLTVYTGVYDKLKLKDTGDGNRSKMMFLYAGPNNDRSVAIPLYFWKIVYEPESRRAVVYVTVNNPYLDDVDDYRVCEKPMFSRDGARMPRLWKPKNLAKGYSYMCDVPDFIRSSGITFHDFSAAMVSGTLYLAKEASNEFPGNGTQKSDAGLNNKSNDTH